MGHRAKHKDSDAFFWKQTKHKYFQLVDYDVNIVLPYAVINDVFNVASTMKEGTEIIAPLKKAFEIYVARLTALESAHRLES